MKTLKTAPAFTEYHSPTGRPPRAIDVSPTTPTRPSACAATTLLRRGASGSFQPGWTLGTIVGVRGTGFEVFNNLTAGDKVQGL